MGTYRDLTQTIADGLLALGDQLDADNEGGSTPEPPTPSNAAASGVYTGDTSSPFTEDDFGAWRGREVQCMLAFTPDDTWSTSWWCSVYGGSYPYRDRLIITRGLCLKNEDVDRSSAGDSFAQWAEAVYAAGIRNPVFRLGHEANGDWYAWKIQGHEDTWAGHFDDAAKQIHDNSPDAKVMLCLAAGQDTEGFAMPATESVDLYGVDIYDLPGHEEVWGDHVAIAREYQAPLCVPEWGLWSEDSNGGHGDNPAYIDAMADRIAADCTGGSEAYFNKDSSSVHRLSAYPNSEQRYLQRFGGIAGTQSYKGHAPYTADPDPFRDKVRRWPR